MIRKLALLTILMTLLSGCEFLSEWRAKIRGQIDTSVSSVSKKVEEVGSQIEKTKKSVEQKIEDIEKAAREVKEAAKEVNEAVEAVKKVTGEETAGTSTK